MPNGKTNLKPSIITAVYNSASTIGDCLNSVKQQTCADIEHIIIDGGSTDGTIDIIRTEGNHVAKFISEPDKGIYDALNKGIRMATGDIIGFLHADDVYHTNTVLQSIADRLTTDRTDSCYGDLLYVHKRNIEKTFRYWRSGPYVKGLFERGWMPPHPTFFVRRSVYEQYGAFNPAFSIAADYELMLRFLVKHQISTTYIPELLVKMRMGGASNSTLRNLFIKTSEDYRAWTINALARKWYTIPMKNISKIPQFLFCGAGR